MDTIADGSSELPPSTNAVVSNDDLLIEILLRLPVISLPMLKSASKRWLTLITNPNFTLRRNRSPICDPPSGIFLQRRSHHYEYDFIPLDIRIPPNRIPLLTTLTHHYKLDVEILQSCNGLLLCRTSLGNSYVYNPSLNKLKTIFPQLHCLKSGGFRMAFDPSKSPHYKIMHARFIEDHQGSSVQIQTYSSRTSSWSVCSDRFPFESFSCFNHGIYWNDAIHWLEGENSDLHFKLDVEHPCLTRIQTPPILDGMVDCGQRLFESRGCLLLLRVGDISSRQLNVYEMSKWNSVWSVKYIVNLNEIVMKYPKTLRKPLSRFCSSVRCIMIGKKEEDSFLVMEIFGKIVQYNILSKTISKIYEFKSNIEHSPVSFQFIASFARV